MKWMVENKSFQNQRLIYSTDTSINDVDIYWKIIIISSSSSSSSSSSMSIQPLGRFGQKPELSQATGMALVRCILGKFLGVACHCFPRVL